MTLPQQAAHVHKWWKCVQVLRNIALRVRALHEAGYVHCNLSPEAVKWYPRENRWMLCEFGHAARAGDARRGGGGISDTKITYAAPEGVAVDGRTESLTLRSDVVAKVPLDVWSFAVVALEVMFGSQLLDSTNEAEVRCSYTILTCFGSMCHLDHAHYPHWLVLKTRAYIRSVACPCVNSAKIL